MFHCKTAPLPEFTGGIKLCDWEFGDRSDCNSLARFSAPREGCVPCNLALCKTYTAQAVVISQVIFPAVGFEPTQGYPIGLAGRCLNGLVKVSLVLGSVTAAHSPCRSGIAVALDWHCGATAALRLPFGRAPGHAALRCRLTQARGLPPRPRRQAGGTNARAMWR